MTVWVFHILMAHPAACFA